MIADQIFMTSSDKHQLDKHRLGVRAAIVRDNAILLVEFDDESGLHYNLPGGGVQPGESIYTTLHREVREEAAAEIEIGRLLLVYEYDPPELDFFDGPQRGLTLLFEGHLKPGSEPRLPDQPDPNEIAVKWIPLTKFPSVTLYPRCQELILKAIGDEYSADEYIRDEHPWPLFTTEI
jgi:8-oxo-dGTP diphosphatase